MITGAVVVPVPDAVLLLAMRRADAGIHIEQNASRRTSVVNAVNPTAGQISKHRKVLHSRQPPGLETPQLAAVLVKNTRSDARGLDTPETHLGNSDYLGSMTYAPETVGIQVLSLRQYSP